MYKSDAKPIPTPALSARQITAVGMMIALTVIFAEHPAGGDYTADGSHYHRASTRFDCDNPVWLIARLDGGIRLWRLHVTYCADFARFGTGPVLCEPVDFHLAAHAHSSYHLLQLPRTATVARP